MCVSVRVHVALPMTTLWPGSLGPLLPRATPTGDPKEPCRWGTDRHSKRSTNPHLTTSTRLKPSENQRTFNHHQSDFIQEIFHPLYIFFSFSEFLLCLFFILHPSPWSLLNGDVKSNTWTFTLWVGCSWRHKSVEVSYEWLTHQFVLECCWHLKDIL